MDDKKISSKAPFAASALFMGLLFWVNQTSLFGDEAGVIKLKLLMIALYGLLAIGAAAYGVYLLKTGQKSIPGPRSSHMIWSVVALAVITAVGLWIV